MTIFTDSFKQSIVKKALENPKIPRSHVAREAGIAPSTIHKWINNYNASNRNLDATSSKKSPQDWTLEERFNMLVETANMATQAQGAYCRQKGIYQHQLTQWREDFMKQKTETKQHQELAELKTLRAENKALRKELDRKDKALAETSALLVLKKKTYLLWGENEED